MGLCLLSHRFPSIQLEVLVHMTLTQFHGVDELRKPTYVYHTPLGLNGLNLFAIRPPSLEQCSESLAA